MANQHNDQWRVVRILALAVALSFCAACATMQPNPAPPPPAAKVVVEPEIGTPPAKAVVEPATGTMPQDSNATPIVTPITTARDTIGIVRYISVDRSKWVNVKKPLNLSELYARIEVETTDPQAGGAPPAGLTRAYHLERRSWLARLFVNRAITITTVAKAGIRNPDVDMSLPLFAIEHDSVRGSGEVFVTNFTSAYAQAPLFRIGPNTTLTVHLNTKMSDQQKTDATALVIKAVQTAVTIAAPTSSVLTTLSKPDLNKASTAIDSAIGGLSSQDLTEDIELGRLVATWQPDAEVEVTANVPDGLVKGEFENPPADGNQSKPTRRGRDMSVGTWHIRLNCPRPSIFDARDLCDPSFDLGRLATLKATIASSVTASQILQTNMSSQVTVQQFIQTQSWYTAFLQKQNKVPDDTKAFCADAVASLYAAGLNQFDTSLVILAMSKKMPGIVTLGPTLQITPNCQGLVSPDIPLPS